MSYDAWEKRGLQAAAVTAVTGPGGAYKCSAFSV